MKDWFLQLKEAKKSAFCDGNLKKVHYDFHDGREMVEEYNTSTNVVTRRAWRLKNKMSQKDQWEIELGEAEPNFNKDDELLIKENVSQPLISKRNTRLNLEWRIRNIPYPIETYSVTRNSEKKSLIVRTSNKKYYKEIFIPELERLHLTPIQDNISFSHKFNTLIITYKKPKELLEFEKMVWLMVKEVKTGNEVADLNSCKPS